MIEEQAAASTDLELPRWPKIPRWKGAGVCVTEKIDGTCSLIHISEDPEEPVRFGSRNRWITPTADNAGFARWCTERLDDIKRLGPGSHFGEFWGLGIQRGYGLTEKRFSLFNTERWNPDNPNRPECCGIVPELYRGELKSDTVEGLLAALRATGSVAAPGFMHPEGIVIYHYAGRHLYKYTLDGDAK